MKKIKGKFSITDFKEALKLEFNGNDLAILQKEIESKRFRKLLKYACIRLSSKDRVKMLGDYLNRTLIANKSAPFKPMAGFTLISPKWRK